MRVISLYYHPPPLTESGFKSSKKKEKELTWRAKQRQRQVAAKQAPLQKPPRPPCKYFMNGICKNVSGMCTCTRNCYSIKHEDSNAIISRRPLPNYTSKLNDCTWPSNKSQKVYCMTLLVDVLYLANISHTYVHVLAHGL